MATRAAGSQYFPRSFLPGCSFLKAMGHILHTRASTGASERQRGQAADLHPAPQLNPFRGIPHRNGPLKTPFSPRLLLSRDLERLNFLTFSGHSVDSRLNAFRRQIRRLFISRFGRCKGIPVIVLRISAKGSLTVTNSSASPQLHAAGRRQDLDGGCQQAIRCERKRVRMAIARSGSWISSLKLPGSRSGENDSAIFTRCKQTKARQRIESEVWL